MRIINNAVPNFAHEDVNDVDLSPKYADDLVECQLTLPNLLYLTTASSFIAGITDSKRNSEKVHKALLKADIISAVSPEGTTTNAPTTTSNIGKNFPHQLAIIGVHAQRKLVGMLFFWEEECARWKLLDEEEAEILTAIGQEGADDGDLNNALEAVRIKMKLLPGQRAEEAADVGGGVGA